MKPVSLCRLFFACALTATTAWAWNDPGFYHPLTFAPADAPAIGGGAGGDDEAAQKAELVRKTLNPVASLISVPIQFNWDFGLGTEEAMRTTVNIQPVIPFSLNQDWNLITRTILPVINQESRFAGDGDHSGLGDILQSFFFSPKEKVGGWILGGGPALLYPSATDSVLGSGHWGAGPTILVMRQEHGFSYGMLVNHLWSYAGWGDQDVNATFLQPFLSYSTKTYTSFSVNTESTYDWEGEQWTVPLNFMVSQMLKVGPQPISLQLGYRYYADAPNGGPEWGLRFAITLLFPK